MSNKEFFGIFKEEFEKYLEYKRAQGYYKKNDGKYIYLLMYINKYLDSYKLNEIQITKEMIENFLIYNKDITQSTKHGYECALRQFSKFLLLRGYKNIYVQYECIVKNPRDYIPYVFSSEEIERIFTVIDNQKFKIHNLESNVLYKTLFRILYCTGIRLGELLDLKIDDVDLNNNIITVAHGKNDVRRILPFTKSLAIYIKQYLEVFPNNKEYFFESIRGGRISNHTISKRFRDVILPEAGINRKNTVINYSRGACVHTLRHTFACNALDKMIKEGKDPYCALPYLSIYMGHTSITNTELYLRLTKERYDEVVACGHYIYEDIGEKYEWFHSSIEWIFYWLFSK